MYTTTYPCHNCTKHIICAGIFKVVYVEPYPKSLADELHSDAILVDEQSVADEPNKVEFSPYRGVAPRRFHHFFEKMEDKKSKEGHIQQRTKKQKADTPRLAERWNRRLRKTTNPDASTAKEMEVARRFLGLLKKNAP